jgi:hypothetical protein
MDQLLRRFSLFDGIARIAFRAQIFYTGTVFLPHVPDGVQKEFRKKLPWKSADAAQAQDGDLDDKDALSDVSDDLEIVVVEQGSCMINVTDAPGVRLQDDSFS